MTNSVSVFLLPNEIYNKNYFRWGEKCCTITIWRLLWLFYFLMTFYKHLLFANRLNVTSSSNQKNKKNSSNYSWFTIFHYSIFNFYNQFIIKTPQSFDYSKISGRQEKNCCWQSSSQQEEKIWIALMLKYFVLYIF